MLDPVKNFAKATLVEGYAAGVTTIVASSGEGAKFPDPSTDGAFDLVWWNADEYGDPADDPFREIVRCTARVADIFTIIRAQGGTSDSDHNLADRTYKIALPFTAKEHDEIAIQYSTISVSSDYTADLFGNILVDTDGASRTISLPPSAGLAGRIYTIKKIDTSAVTDVIVQPDGTETIDGNATIELRKPYTALRIVSNGEEWFII